MSQAKEKKAGSRTVDLLWTGGWDSTYRLLHLLLINKFAVNIHYIISRRQSIFKEMETMIKIQEKIFKTYPETVSLFKKMVFFSKNCIPDDKEITERTKNLKKIMYIGSQYEWIIRYARAFYLTGIEMSIHVDDKAAAHVEQQVEFIQESDGHSYWRLKKGVSKEDDLSVFSIFHFPIIKLSKLDMKDSAKKYGFENILNMTWFCHTPIRGKPCGVCHPCRYSLDEGMGFRFPLSSVLRYKWMYDPSIRKIRYFIQYIHRTLKKMFNHASNQSNDKKEVS